MVLDTGSVDSGYYIWELMSGDCDFLTSRQEAQITTLCEGAKGMSSHTEITCTSDYCDSDEESFIWEELLPNEGEEDERKKGGELGVSCETFGWQERSSTSTFSLYCDINEKSQVSLLEASMDNSEFSEETYDDNRFSSPTSVSHNDSFADTVVFEFESVSSEVIEMDEDSTQSEYEVNSVVTEMIDGRVGYRWGAAVDSFAERIRKRNENAPVS